MPVLNEKTSCGISTLASTWFTTVGGCNRVRGVSFERSHHHCLSLSSTASIALALLLLVLLLVLACMLGHNI